MKKLIIGLLLLFAVCSVWGQQKILYKDNFTIQYDAPAVMPNLLTGESLVYRVWLWDMSQGPPFISGTVGWAFYAETLSLEQYVVTPQNPRLEYAVGIETIFIRADLIEVSSGFAVTTEMSDIDPGGIPGVPFVYAPASLPVPGKVRNLRDSGI